MISFLIGLLIGTIVGVVLIGFKLADPDLDEVDMDDEDFWY